MINDVYLRFKELYLETGGKLLIQNFLLEKEPSICIKVDKDGNVIDKLIAIDDSVKKDDLYDWFAIRNIKSKYLSSNKSVGSKMIFSSNNYTLFGRIDTFPIITYQSFIKLFDVKEDAKNKKTTAKSIFYNKYKKELKVIFTELLSPIALTDLIDKMDFISEDDVLLIKNSFITEVALNSYYQKLCDSYECIDECFFSIDKLNYILTQIDKEIIEYAHKSIKLKIFRDVDINNYEHYELNYLTGSLFATEKKVLLVKDNKLGQPYLDNTLNSDKPFMFYTTTKFQIAFPKVKDEVLYIKYLDDYLSMNKGIFYLELEKFSVSKKPLLNREQFIIQKKKNYELFEFLPFFVNEFQNKPFVIKNYMRIHKKKKLIDNKQPYTELYLLEKEIDSLCSKKLISNYFTEKIKNIDKRLESYIFMLREACILYFKKSQITGKEFYSQIEKVISYLILYQYEKNEDKFILHNVLENLNLKLSMKQYFKGEEMDIKQQLESLNSKISDDKYESLSIEEFLLLSGQMAYYLISQTESSDRTFRLAEHYLKAKNVKSIKNHLRNDLERYKHKVYLNTKKSKFKNALAMCIAFDKEYKLTHNETDMFLIGLVSENIFYMGKKEQ